jgi:hypothetical protein
MNNESRTNLDGSSRGLIQIISRCLPGWAEKNHENSISGIPVEIRTEYLRNMSLERHRYTNLPGVPVVLSSFVDFLTHAGICEIITASLPSKSFPMHHPAYHSKLHGQDLYSVVK